MESDLPLRFIACVNVYRISSAHSHPSSSTSRDRQPPAAMHVGYVGHSSRDDSGWVIGYMSTWSWVGTCEPGTQRSSLNNTCRYRMHSVYDMCYICIVFLCMGALP